MDNTRQISVSPAPHIKSADTVSSVMLDVIIALIPAFIASVWFFGLKALVLIVSCVFFSVISEHLCQILMKRKSTIKDYSAVVTGLLLAFCLPPTLPWYLGAIGAIFAVVAGKMVFGGLGYNIFNPALVGRAFLLASWPVFMTKWTGPESFGQDNWFSITDATTSASPLTVFKESIGIWRDSGNIEALTQIFEKFSLNNLFLGNISGSLGETSAIALLLGAFYIWFYKKHITWHIPVTFIATVGLLNYVFTANGYLVLFQIFSGGLILGAFFMATDMVTTPITPKGRVIFGLGCGILVFIIRMFGGYPEGVCYSILIMNAATPLIDNYTKPRIFGEVK